MWKLYFLLLFHPAASVYCRYLQRVVAHPSLLQDPDVREFLEREEVSIMYLLDLFWRQTASSALLAVYDCPKLMLVFK